MEWTRPVHLAGPPELTSTCVVPALAQLVANGLNLQVSFGRPAERLLDGLSSGAFDIVVSTMRPTNPDVEVTKLFDEHFVLVVAVDRAEKIDLSLLQREPRALLGIPLIAYAGDLPVIRRYFRQVFGTEPTMRADAVVPDFRAVLALTIGGAGVTVLPRYLCRSELASGVLVALLDPPDPPVNTVYLATGLHAASEVLNVRQRLLEQASTWS